MSTNHIVITVSPKYSKWKAIGYSISDIATIADIIKRSCQARPSGYEHMRKYVLGMWDGYIRLAKGSDIPTGLMYDVADALELDNFSIEIHDELPYPDVHHYDISWSMFDGITLRDYQLQAANTLLEQKRGVAKMATNSGKTEVIAIICKAISSAIIVLTTKKDLLYQARDRLSLRLGEEVGMIGDSEFDIRRITVGMIQTLSKHPDMIKSLQVCDCVIFDECHHVPSRTAQDVMYGLNAVMRFGFSGTPLKHNLLSDLTLIGATGPVIVDISNNELIESGISARPMIEMHVISNKSTKRDFKLAWKDAYEKYVICNGVRNELIASIVESANANSTLVLVERLDHGKKLQELITASEFVSGGSDITRRLSARTDLGAKNHVKVISTPIFDEGVDLPAVDLLILAGGGKAMVKLLQRIGRGMRHKDGKNEVRIIDFVDDTNIYLLSHSKERAEIYESEGFEVKVIDHAPTQIGLL